MPTTFKVSSLLPQQHRCTCQCNKEDNNAITRWFPRIRRRSSSSSSTSSSSVAAPYSRRASADSIIEIEDRHVNEFLKTYELAVDEVMYKQTYVLHTYTSYSFILHR